MEFQTIDKFAKNVAEKALDEFIYEGKTIREWVEIIAEQQPSEDTIIRQAVLEQINCWIGSGEYGYTNATHYLTRRIQELPPVTPRQEPILDKIRAEIDERYDKVRPYNIYCAEGLEMALEIIDKYKESEE